MVLNLFSSHKYSKQESDGEVLKFRILMEFMSEDNVGKY